jgi:hypothetical protein
VGDTDHGAKYQAVLQLIKEEKAEAFVAVGDMTYTGKGAAWWGVTEAALGPSFPVFLAHGGHDDSSWPEFMAKQPNHLGGASETKGPTDATFKRVFRGIALLALKKGDTGDTVKSMFAGDTSTWKVCYFHFNMALMTVGRRGDHTGWGVYEACRAAGALIVTAHHHGYNRTKTLTSMSNTTIDPTCFSGDRLCVGPGRSFVLVSGNGGAGMGPRQTHARCLPAARLPPHASLNTTDPTCRIWASIYTVNQGGASAFGSTFISFGVDGNPKKALGYFKNIAKEVIDTFEITVE